jgi:hypothetical protein
LLSALTAPEHYKTRLFLETRGPFLLLGFIVMDGMLNLNILSSIFGKAIELTLRLFV